jgi:leucyl aminopeptidase
MHFGYFEGNIRSLETDLLAVAAYSDTSITKDTVYADIDDALDGLLTIVAEEEGFEGKDGQLVQLHTHGKIGARRIVLIGLGKAGNNDARRLSARASRLARKMGMSRMSLVAPNGTSDNAHFLVEGAVLGHYSFDHWKTKDVKPSKLSNIDLINTRVDEAQIATTQRIAEGVSLARDLVNEPPVTKTPSVLAQCGRDIAKENNLDCTIFDKAALIAKGMKLILAVSAGSAEEPRLIHLTYRPDGANEDTPSVALVGKGLTFDAGGLCLKPAGSMEDMKLDMAGGAAVLGAMKAINAVKPNVIVHAIVPSSENLLGAEAYKPGDVIRGYAGKTVEVVNTDAEGRLILADALAYAAEQGVEEIIDLATLTGAICVALGNETAGIFSNDDALADEIVASAEVAGESVWKMPLDQRLKKQLKSDVADMKNCGERWGGAITGALFLEEFKGDGSWVHIDLAGPSFASKVRDHVGKGGTGFGVTTLLTYLKRAGDRLSKSS